MKRIAQVISDMPRLKKSKYLALEGLAKSAQLAPLLLEMKNNLATDLLLVASQEPSLSNQVMLTINSQTTNYSNLYRSFDTG